MKPLALGALSMFLSGTCMLALPGVAEAQYRCGVAIELKGKAILQGTIRDVERPPTDELWELLKTLSFAPNKSAKDVPDPTVAETTTLKGDLRVTINGAGHVDVKELGLVRNKYAPETWQIAPAEVTRILKLRKVEEPKK